MPDPQEGAGGVQKPQEGGGTPEPQKAPENTTEAEKRAIAAEERAQKAELRAKQAEERLAEEENARVTETENKLQAELDEYKAKAEALEAKEAEREKREKRDTWLKENAEGLPAIYAEKLGDDPEKWTEEAKALQEQWEKDAGTVKRPSVGSTQAEEDKPKGATITAEDVANMSAGEIAEHWDAVQAALKA